MTVIMYERVGADGRRPSPFSWRNLVDKARKLGISVWRHSAEGAACKRRRSRMTGWLPWG